MGDSADGDVEKDAQEADETHEVIVKSSSGIGVTGGVWYCCTGMVCCSMTLALIVGIAVLASIETLSPNEQVVVHFHTEKRVVNGPCTKIFHPFRTREFRKAQRLAETQYAIIKDDMTAEIRVETGPKLMFLGAYENVAVTKEAFLLRKDEYIRLVDRQNGTQRLLLGPQAVVPTALEEAPHGVEQGVIVTEEWAPLVHDKMAGTTRLVTELGIFVPNHALEVVVGMQQCIRPEPYQSYLVKHHTGDITIYSGVEAGGRPQKFFVPPHGNLVEMVWSAYSAPRPGKDAQAVESVRVVSIDSRVQRVFFRYGVITNDGVNLNIDGTFFWKVVDIPKLVNTTLDPVGDVWNHAGANLVSDISRLEFSTLLSNFSGVIQGAFEAHRNSQFFQRRGVELRGVEVSSFTFVNEETSESVQEIIAVAIDRISALDRQQGANEVLAAEMAADAELARLRQDLSDTTAQNVLFQNQSVGAANGARMAGKIITFQAVLSKSIPADSERMALYRFRQEVGDRSDKARGLAESGSSLILSHEEVGGLNFRLASGIEYL